MPSPWLNHFDQSLLDPDWTRLHVWNALRAAFVGGPAGNDPKDLTASRPDGSLDDDTSPLRAATDTFTALVCRGCCCATGDVSELGAAQLAAIRAAAHVVDGARVRLTDCLGPCDQKNVIAVRHRLMLKPGARIATTWLGSLTTKGSVPILAAWLSSGANPAALPAALSPHLLDRSIKRLPDCEITVAAAEASSSGYGRD